MKILGKISIIIPTYNRAHLIGETLNSVLAQTYPHWECLVIDDGSTDGTTDVVQDYVKSDSRFRYYKRPKDRPKGANACRNYGFELSQGDFINWFDDDDLMHIHLLEMQLNNLTKGSGNFSVCHAQVFENTSENILGLRSQKIYSKHLFKDYLEQEIVWMTPAALWKKSYLNTLDYLFDEELMAAQEWEFHCRVLLNQHRYEVIDKPLVFIRKHINSISHNINDKQKKYYYFLARLKIYKILLLQNDFYDCLEYLKGYFKKYMISCVRSGNVKQSLHVYGVMHVNKLRLTKMGRLAFYISVLTYKFFGKGEIFIHAIHYRC